MVLIALLVAKIQLLVKALDIQLLELIKGINARLVVHIPQTLELVFLM
jgi:hypothetical protein